ncbi:MAG: hypothetical protein ACHQF2_08560 [Flavobacteriales bacterium]
MTPDTKLQVITCPVCKSDNVSKARWSKQAIAISLLLLGLPLPIKNKVCHCFDCGLDFKINKKTTRDDTVIDD